MDATSPDALATTLAEAGITPIHIAPARARPVKAKKKFSLRWRGGRVRLDDLIVFSRQMATLTEAGLPIVGAIQGLAESARNATLRQALLDLAESLQSGRELSSSMQRHPQVFSSLFVAVVSVGENTGRLDESFREISRYLELEQETRRRINTATRYPTLVVCAIVAAIFMLNLFVLPVFSETFKSRGTEIPWATQLLMAASDFTVAYWVHVLVAMGAAAVGLRTYTKTPHGRFVWHRYKLMLPVMGGIIKRATLARYARTVAMTAHSGLPVNRSLEIAMRAVDNDYIAERVGGMRRAIERGENLTRAAAGSGLFEPLIMQMMGVGEQTGTLAEMHRHIAGSYEGEVDYDLRRLSDLIEPLLVAAVGGIVLILALGVYLPMWDFGK
jgi:MSHA biogenesis protein MshG